jgi:Restriction endonuclease/ATP cone domain
MNNHMLVTKADGSRELFNEEKLVNSLTKVGVRTEDRGEIIDRVRDEVRHGISTAEIFAHAMERLRGQPGVAAARYSIKRAVLALGPSGFPFEKYIAEVLKAHGATNVMTDVTLNGACVPHEVDILAEMKGVRIGIEAKFHNSAGLKTEIKDMLYVHARFQDLVKAKDRRIDAGWLITNTRFTTHAQQYAMCANVQAIGWDYPLNRGIQHLIEGVGLMPLTALTTLTHIEAQALLKQGYVLARELRDRPDRLKAVGIEHGRFDLILTEASQLSVSRKVADFPL